VTECGQTLHQNAGIIEYKLNQTYDADELCVFIIRFKGQSGVHFKLEKYGFSDTEVRPLKIADMDYFGEFYYIEEMDNLEVFIEETFGVFVIFKTNSTKGTGFRLSFETLEYHGEYRPGNDYVYNLETRVQLDVPFWPFDSNTSYNYNLNNILCTWDSHVVSEPGATLRLTVSENFTEGGYCDDGFIVASLQNDRFQVEEV